MNNECLKEFCNPKVGDQIQIISTKEYKIVSEVEKVLDVLIFYTEDNKSYGEDQIINVRIKKIVEQILESDFFYLPKPEIIDANTEKREEIRYLSKGIIIELWMKFKKLFT
jgi:hypothetical protein